MSERYGAPGEQDFGELEDWLQDEIARAVERNNAVRAMALRDVVDFIVVNPGG